MLGLQQIILWICLSISFLSHSQSLNCRQYLLYLQSLYVTNHQQFKSQLAPYLLFSGKAIDDLGYAASCLNNPDNRYTTVQLQYSSNETDYFGYMGLCFASKCSVNDLNQNGHFIVDYILEDFYMDFTSTFIEPGLKLQFSPLALTFGLMFGLFAVLGMLSPIKAWYSMCNSEQEQEQYAIKSAYVNLDHPDVSYDEEDQIQSQPIIKKISLRQKWRQIWKTEESKKIYSFSLFRLLAFPLLVYGEIFFEGNKASFNYTAFQLQIYTQLFSKIAMVAYYIPDIFFMISGFLFCKKILSIDPANDPYIQIAKEVGYKLIRLYPLYISAFLIYWCITPALHCGPVWFVYQNQVAVCNSAWWRVFLMIDNWFTDGCYQALWFVQVQVQLTLFIVIFFLIYYTHNTISYYYFAVIFVASLCLMLFLSAELPVNLAIILKGYSTLYFKSFYSHLFFYLWGTLLALLANNTSLKQAIQDKILQNSTLMIIFSLSTAGLFILVLLLPSIWTGTEVSLKFQLSLCRIAIALGFTFIFLNGMFRQNRETHHTVIHKYGYYVYPMILCSYFVMQGSFWSVSSFFYMDGINVINHCIPIIAVSGSTGLLLGLMMDFRGLINSQK